MSKFEILYQICKSNRPNLQICANQTIGTDRYQHFDSKTLDFDVRISDFDVKILDFDVNISDLGVKNFNFWHQNLGFWCQNQRFVIKSANRTVRTVRYVQTEPSEPNRRQWKPFETEPNRAFHAICHCPVSEQNTNSHVCTLLLTAQIRIHPA